MSETFKAKKIVGPNAGHVTQVTLTEGHHISSSATRARDVKTAQIQTVRGNESPTLMALKDYSDKLHPNLLGAVEENYKRCSEAGLKVFPTFRIDHARKQILMTYLNRGDMVAISSNNSSSEAPTTKFIERVDNMSSFLTALYEEAIKAADNNIYLPSDAYLFLASVGNTKNRALDFIVGDYDSIRISDGRANTELRKNNLFEAKRAISEFYTKYFQENSQNTRALGLIRKEYTMCRKRFGIR